MKPDLLTLYKTYLPFLRKYTSKCSKAEDRADVLQELVRVMVQKYPNWDSTKGTFITYLRPYFKQAMREQMKILARSVDIRSDSSTYRDIQKIKHFKQATYKLQGRHPTIPEIAQYLNTTEKRVGKLLVYAERISDG